MRFSEAYDPLRALGDSWRLVRRAPAVLLVGGALLVLLGGGGGSGVQFRPGGGGAEGLLTALILFGACAIGLAVFAFVSLVRVGFTRAVRRAAAEGADDIGDLFRGTDAWLALVLCSLLQGLVLVVVSIPGLIVAGLLAWLGHAVGGEGAAAAVGVLTFLFYLPFIVYVMLGLSLAKNAVALEDCDPISALERSWSLVEGNRGRLFLYCVALWICSLLGLLACCVGVFFTGALAEVASVESFLRLTTPEADQEAWWLTRSEEAGPAGPPRSPHDGPPPPAPPPPALDDDRPPLA